MNHMNSPRQGGITSDTTISYMGLTHAALRMAGTELSLWIDGVKDFNTATFKGTTHAGTAP
tara:strand:- start:263 stop:445 length:183 start_codon:yes stop_codon:yes gene_type:complete